MKLVVFDLDGTLASTFAVDEECFIQSLVLALGIEKPNTNWSEYEHVTDSGVVQEAFARTFGRMPSTAEISRFVECFVDLLSCRYQTENRRFCEVAGAASLIARLKANSEWRAAIATGGWERSARLKMKMANLGTEDHPAAFAEDGPSRETIVRTAITRARAHYEQERFEKIVSVGDAAWDVQTARRLQLAFIGVGNYDRSAKLRNVGATHVLENFLDYESFLQTLEEARTPDPEHSR